MKAWLAMAAGVWLGLGCTVPGDEAVRLQRLCRGRDLGAREDVLRLADDATCDRAVVVAIEARGFNPGCIDLLLRDSAHEALGALQLTGPSRVTRELPRQLRVLLSPRQGDSLELLATAHEGACGTQVVSHWTQRLQVRPGAVGSETVVVSATDQDNDGYVTAAEGGTDCDDQDPTVHPGQAETRCDGKDENCDGAKDSEFGVGSACVEGAACAGVRSCRADQLDAECVSYERGPAWFVDEDGDGQSGTFVGNACSPPIAGASLTAGDCDESSPFVALGLPEVCDRLDNDCDGQVDNTFCSGNAGWRQMPDAGTARWDAVAGYGQDRAWVVGDGGRMAHVVGNTIAAQTSCAGTWQALWASHTGRLFLAGAAGSLAMRTLGTGCTITQVPGVTGNLRGLTGFEGVDGESPTIYAVSDDGSVVRWAPPAAPVRINQVVGELRAISGAGTEDSMVAVGGVPLSIEFDGGVTSYLPRAFRHVPASGGWQEEPLDPDGGVTGIIQDVHVLHGGHAFATTSTGQILARDHGVWRPLPNITGSGAFKGTFTSVVAHSKSVVYVAASKDIYRYSEGAWSLDFDGGSGNLLYSIDGPSPTNVWAVGDKGTVVHLSF
ncbi:MULTISPECIES: putative metal-binding motif-containing protein [Corallococcus]|uniref:putative metal-binding motif-containing protein n=1 Tax=Corallococcus TaxID=83461 RepID=UPI00117BE76B|nr:MULTISPECIES: putative metal-binding motif-containing protein [Corallococcus]NBD08548.1 hypothetical protein [Corallococcus silvisoli]TSC33148.1 hypothetical protein FOF48_05805 [Corallococcus sp. Z5C101001]